MPKTLDQHINGLQNFLNGNDDTDDEKTQTSNSFSNNKTSISRHVSRRKERSKKGILMKKTKILIKKIQWTQPEKDTDKKDSMDDARQRQERFKEIKERQKWNG